MKLDRRNFLGTMGLGMATAALWPREGASSLFAAAPATRFLVLRSSHQRSEIFTRSVRAGLERLGISGAAVAEADAPSSTDFAGWKKIAEGVRGGVVMGLLSEADAILLNEALRESGGRLLCRGTHVTGEGRCSRHAFDTTEASSGVGVAFARRLELAGQDALVFETAAVEAAPLASTALPAIGTADWTELLAGSVARIAAGRFEPGSVVGSVRVGASDPFGSVQESFVSFAAVV